MFFWITFIGLMAMSILAIIAAKILDEYTSTPSRIYRKPKPDVSPPVEESDDNIDLPDPPPIFKDDPEPPPIVEEPKDPPIIEDPEPPPIVEEEKETKPLPVEDLEPPAVIVEEKGEPDSYDSSFGGGFDSDKEE